MSNAALYLVLLFAPASAVELRRQADALQVEQPVDMEHLWHYFWPHGRGQTGKSSGGKSYFMAPFDLEKTLSWTWHDESHGNLRYANVPNGVNIDDHRSIYLTSLDGIRKFNEYGKLLWQWVPVRKEGEEFPDTASIAYGALYVSSTEGRVFSINMMTGVPIWETQLDLRDPARTKCKTSGTNGWMSVDDGVVILGNSPGPGPTGLGSTKGKTGDKRVAGLNASYGYVMWNFDTEAPVWNFQASFAGDGTFVFQDYEGRAYRMMTLTGQRVWTKGGVKGSFTDGSAILGPNQLVYTQANRRMKAPGVHHHGDVIARSLKNGEVHWQVEVPESPNNIPAVGFLFGSKKLSLVQPIGVSGFQGAPTYVYAFDAATGEVQWIFHGPVAKSEFAAGDGNIAARSDREKAGVRRAILPNAWSAPSIDGSGNVYIGHQDGMFYALRDANGDGKVDGTSEVSSYNTSACFSPSASPAIAPGMVVMPSCDQLYVFNVNSGWAEGRQGLTVNP